MFLFYPIHFLKFRGKSQPQRSYKNGSYKIKKSVMPLLKFIPDAIKSSFIKTNQSFKSEEKRDNFFFFLYI